MDWPTIIVAAAIAGIFLAIVICGMVNKKKGKSGCSCGGSCGSCPSGCGCHMTDN